MSYLDFTCYPHAWSALAFVPAIDYNAFMSKVITVHIEKLPEGVYVATSKDLQGLVAQGRTIEETLAIARDVATKLLELQGFSHKSAEYQSAEKSRDYSLVVAT